MAYLMTRGVVPANVTLSYRIPPMGQEADAARTGSLIGLAIAGGVLFWLFNAAYKEKEEHWSARSNPYGWTSWKWEFIRIFQRRWGIQPKSLGFRSRDYYPYYERGLSVASAVDDFSREHGIGHRRIAGNPPRKSYYVKIKGVGATYGPYTLKSAKSFARIGSQTGNDRYVLRGGPSGSKVRQYSGGERVWPIYESQLRGLLSSEHPKRLN
jgi:hypothetical protein